MEKEGGAKKGLFPGVLIAACFALLRDLHWGNVLVKTTKAKKGTFLLDGTNHSLETKGVLVHIIDFSLSRLEIGQSLLLYSIFRSLTCSLTSGLSCFLKGVFKSISSCL